MRNKVRPRSRIARTSASARACRSGAKALVSWRLARIKARFSRTCAAKGIASRTTKPPNPSGSNATSGKSAVAASSTATTGWGASVWIRADICSSASCDRSSARPRARQLPTANRSKCPTIACANPGATPRSVNCSARHSASVRAPTPTGSHVCSAAKPSCRAEISSPVWLAISASGVSRYPSSRRSPAKKAAICSTSGRSGINAN